MMRLMRHIALIWLLLWCCAGGSNIPDKTLLAAPEAQLTDRGVEERTLVRQHAHLNLPSSVESLHSVPQLTGRTPAKTHSRHHHGAHDIAPRIQKASCKKHGGPLCLHTVTLAHPIVELSRLCRLII
ncbi:MAG: hypothetical protein IJW80_06160 [Alistipes sp.]|nr:hypothetical protein [Alistipes sp.]